MGKGNTIIVFLRCFLYRSARKIKKGGEGLIALRMLTHLRTALISLLWVCLYELLWERLSKRGKSLKGTGYTYNIINLYLYLYWCKCNEKAEPWRDFFRRSSTRHRVQLGTRYRQLLKTQPQQVLHVGDPDDGVIFGQSNSHVAELGALRILN